MPSPSRGEADKSILFMNGHPSAVVNRQGPPRASHIDLLAEFSYLGPPHNISLPSHATSPIATELREASRRLGSS
jgi:hypothetical protein